MPNENKSLSIGANIEPKVSPKFERILKQMGNSTAKALNTPELKKMNVEWTKILKNYEQFGKIDQRLTKQLRDQSSKAWKEQTKLVESFNREMNRSVKIYADADKIAARWAQKRVAFRYGAGTTLEDLPTGVRQGILTQQAGMAEGLRGRAAATQASGMEFMRDMAERQQADKAEARARLTENIMKVAAWGQAASAAVGVVGQVYGFGMREASYEAAARSFGGDMYRRITSGGAEAFGTMFDISRDPSRMANLISNARTASQLGLASDIGGSAFGLLGKGAVMTAMPGSAAFMAGGAMGDVSTLSNSIMDAAAGKVSADVAGQANKAVALMGQMSPIQRQLMMEYAGNLPEYGRLAALSQMGAQAPLLIGEAGVRGGIGRQGGMQVYQGLRGALSESAATYMMGTAARGEFDMNIGREATVGGLTRMATMAQGQAGAEDRLINVMRKATALGIKDSTLREAIVTAMGGMGTEGRLTSTAQMEMQAGLLPNMATMQDVKEIVGGGQLANKLFSGSSGYLPADVARQNRMLRLARSAGMDREGAMLLSGVSWEQALGRGSQWQAITEGMTGEKAEQLRTDVLRGQVETWQATTGIKNPKRLAVALSQMFGIPYETALSAIEQGLAAPGAKGGAATTDEMGFQAPGAPELRAASTGVGAAELDKLRGFLADPKALEGLAAMGAALAVAAPKLRELSDTALGDPGQVLTAAAAGLDKLTASARNFIDTVNGGTSDEDMADPNKRIGQ